MQSAFFCGCNIRSGVFLCYLLLWGVFSFGQMFRDVQNIPVISAVFRNSHTIVHCDFDYCFSVGFNDTQLPVSFSIAGIGWKAIACRLQKIEQRQKWLFNIKIPVSPLVLSFASEHAFSAVEYSQVTFLQLPSTSRRVWEHFGQRNWSWRVIYAKGGFQEEIRVCWSNVCTMSVLSGYKSHSAKFHWGFFDAVFKKEHMLL